MAFIAQPLFAGDLYDAARRLAGDAAPALAAGVSARQASTTKAAGTASLAPRASAAWRQMLELSWQGVVVPESLGGVGATLMDLAALVEGMAHSACSVPVASRCGVAPTLLARATSAAPQHARTLGPLLEQMSVGIASVCPVLDGERGSPGRAAALRIDDDGVLRGRLTGADLSEPATHLLVRARRQSSPNSIAHADAGADGRSAIVLLNLDELMHAATAAGAVRWHVGIDDRCIADFDLVRIPAIRGQILLEGDAADAAVASARRVGAVLGCARSVGAMAGIIEQTIDYLNDRSQFDVRLSSFQALRHRVVEMYVAYENLSGLVRQTVSQVAADSPSTQAEGADFTSELAMLKLYTATVSRQVAESAIQLHGGMGMTLELQAPRLAMSVLATSLDDGERGECLDWLVERATRSAAADEGVLVPLAA